MKRILFLFFQLLCTFMVAQESTFTEVRDSILKQLTIFPQEKIHLHTDRTMYVPGEKIRFKAYLADAFTHESLTSGQYVYVELINSSDSLVHRVMVSNDENGLFHGFVFLSEMIPEGDYTLRAYTRYLENMGDDYFFKKNIRIGNIGSPTPALPKREREGISLSPTLPDREGGRETPTLPDKEGGRERSPTPALCDREGEGISPSPTLPDREGGRDMAERNAQQSLNSPLVGELEGAFDVSFFPEGGNTAEGVVNRIAFKALTRKGTSVFITGEIVDGEGVSIADVTTVFAGMGSFAFIPEPDMAYYLNCRNSAGQAKRFKLPAATRTLSLGAGIRNGQHFVQLKKSPGIAETPLFLLVHCKGEVCYFAPWNHRSEYISISKEQLPEGVLQIVLLDNEMNPVSERLVFNKNSVAEAVEFQPDKTLYGTREKVNVTLTTPFTLAMEGEGLSHFSVAVTDDKDIPVDSLNTITATLLLSSELRGYIESPGYYLQDNASAEYALDHLMMTHGWRRYELPEVIKGNYSLPSIGYEMEKEMTGRVRSGLFDRPTVNAEIIIFSSDGAYSETQTDADGRFRFGLHFPDSVSFFVQAINQKGSEGVELIIDSEPFPKLKYAPVSRSLLPAATAPESTLSDFISKAGQRAQYDEDIRVVNLEEVVVTANRMEKRDEERLKFPLNRLSDVTIYREEIERRGVTDITQLFTGISGSLYLRQRVSLMTNAKNPQFPLVIVNGTPLYWNEETTATPFDDININDVESIDIFRGTHAVLFGMQGGNGVISITTKSANSRTNDNTVKANTISVNPLGFQQPVEFYAPVYDTPALKYNGIPDYRTTIYWKPDIIVSDMGQAIFEFYTADFPTTYSVVIEGLTTNGTIIRQVEKIVVRDETVNLP